MNQNINLKLTNHTINHMNHHILVKHTTNHTANHTINHMSQNIPLKLTSNMNQNIPINHIINNTLNLIEHTLTHKNITNHTNKHLPVDHMINIIQHTIKIYIKYHHTNINKIQSIKNQ